jgi:hypothetical protein
LQGSGVVRLPHSSRNVRPTTAERPVDIPVFVPGAVHRVEIRMAWVVGVTGFGLPEQRGAWHVHVRPLGVFAHSSVDRRDPRREPGCRWRAPSAENTLAWMLADDPAAHTHPAVTVAGVRIGNVCPIRVKGRREWAHGTTRTRLGQGVTRSEVTCLSRGAPRHKVRTAAVTRLMCCGAAKRSPCQRCRSAGRGATRTICT